MDTKKGHRRWRLEPAPVYAGNLYCRIVIGLFVLSAVLYFTA